MYKSPALTFHQLFDIGVVGGLSKFVCVLACDKYMLCGDQKSLSLTKKKKKAEKQFFHCGKTYHLCIVVFLWQTIQSCYCL